jgi:hypothetical protein
MVILTKPKAISTLRTLLRLIVLPPPVHPAQDHTQPTHLPRITPEPQRLVPPGFQTVPLTPEPEDWDEDPVHGIADEAASVPPRAVGRGGWGLGPSWENLEALTLGRLSSNGVSIVA